MSAMFEELDYCPTAIGALSLRRRRDPCLGEIFEIMIGDAFRMTSAFTASEVALARLGTAALDGAALEVVVGCVTLGYTARAVLDHEDVSPLIVGEFLEPVIEWHRDGLLPLVPRLIGDERCRFVRDDERPNARFLDVLGAAFVHVRAEPVVFHNPLQDREFTQTVYLAGTVRPGAA